MRVFNFPNIRKVQYIDMIPTPYEALSEMGKAYAHPTRLQILDILSQDEACVCHLTAILGQRQAHVSQHLRVLKDANLVTNRREGLMVYYRLADARAAAIVSLLKELQRRVEPAVVFPTVPRPPAAGCPCPKCTREDSS